jgi:ABC-2 type transport system permease protein
MKMLTFAQRNAKEILRDPLNLSFMFGFPLVLLLLLSAIQANIPVALFVIDHLTPGVTVFGMSFMTLFSATVIAKDRQSSLLQRLYTTPMKAADFILGYGLPLLPISLLQAGACYAVALLLGLELSGGILLALLGILPVSVLYIGMGLLCGSVLTDKQVGGVCGGLLTNLSAWLAGIWFDLDLVGGVFRRVAYCLPFVHAVQLERALLKGNLSAALPHLRWVLGYGAVTVLAAVALFLRQMKKN